jgi:hypothetical protein
MPLKPKIKLFCPDCQAKLAEYLTRFDGLLDEEPIRWFGEFLSEDLFIRHEFHACFLRMAEMEKEAGALHVPVPSIDPPEGEIPGSPCLQGIRDLIARLRGLERRLTRREKINFRNLRTKRLDGGQRQVSIEVEGWDELKSIVKRGRPKKEMRILAEEHLRSNPRITAAPLVTQIDPTAKGSRRNVKRVRLQSAITKSRKAL